MKGYFTRRFDEIGYPACPGIDAHHIQQYIQRHDIGMIVTFQPQERADNRILKNLSIPTLAFNSRNLQQYPESQLVTSPSLFKARRVGRA